MYSAHLRFQNLPPTATVWHGKPREKTYFNEDTPFPHVAGWIGKSVMQLQALGYDAYAPAIQNPYTARYEYYDEAMGGRRVDARSLFVGFSRGASAFVNWASDRPAVHFDEAYLVSYWSDPEREYEGSQGDFKIDKQLPERCNRIHLLYDPKDAPVVASLEAVREAWRDWAPDKVSYVELPGRGHMLPYETQEIPELTAVLASKAIAFS